jgi:hypothetical protein
LASTKKDSGKEDQQQTRSLREKRKIEEELAGGGNNRMLGVTDWKKASQDRNQWRQNVKKRDMGSVLVCYRILRLSHGPKWPVKLQYIMQNSCRKVVYVEQAP